MTWFNDWLAVHLRRHETLGLPDPTRNFDLYDAWRSEFARLGVNEPAANHASRLLASRPCAKGSHFPALVRLAMKAMRCQNRAEPAAVPCGGDGDYADDGLDYTHYLPRGRLRDLAEKLRPPGIEKGYVTAEEHTDAQDLPARATRRDEDARRDHPRALPARPVARSRPAHQAPVRAGG